MIKTIAGPWSKAEAQETAKELGRQYTAFGELVNDADGYADDAASDLNWFIERDDSILPERIFGLTWEEIVAKQQGR